MRSRTPRHILALAIGVQHIHIADVRLSRGGAAAEREATLPLTPGCDLDSPAKLGAALAELLKAKGFRTTQTAVGLCSRWVLASPRSLPPVEDDALAGLMRLQIERDYAGGKDDLIFDFTEPTPPNGQRKLVLVGTQRRRLQQMTQAALAAGLRVTHAMPTALAAAAQSKQDGLAVVLEDGGAALVHTVSGRSLGLTSCGFDPADIGSGDPGWVRDIASRAMGLAPVGTPATMIDAAALSESQRQSAQAALAPRMGQLTSSQTNPAVAVGAAVLRGQQTGNFISPRLVEKKKRSIPPAAQWAIRAAVLLLLIVGFIGYRWYEAKSKLAAIRDEYDTIHEQAQRLAEVRNDIKAASGWYDKRPPILDCMLELTQTFPRRGRIWVTALTLDDSTRGTLTCKAQDKETMFSYLGAMKGSPNLLDVKLRDWSTTDRESQTVQFEVTFIYQPSDRPRSSAQVPTEHRDDEDNHTEAAIVTEPAPIDAEAEEG